MSFSLSEEEILTGVFPNPAELSNWVRRNVPTGSPAYFIGERIPQKWLDDSERKNDLRFTRHTGEFDAGEFESGYFFAKEFEVRWKREPKGICVRYIGRQISVPEPLGQAKDQLTGEIETSEIQYQLWGRRIEKKDLTLIGEQVTDDAFFASARIPRVLQYPASDKAKIMYLCVREYRDHRAGYTLLWRFAGVKEKP
jgi:hypothetical protein